MIISIILSNLYSIHFNSKIYCVDYNNIIDLTGNKSILERAELLKSAAPALLESGDCSLQALMLMEEDLEKIGNDQNAIFFYQFVQAKATL